MQNRHAKMINPHNIHAQWSFYHTIPILPMPYVYTCISYAKNTSYTHFYAPMHTHNPWSSRHAFTIIFQKPLKLSTLLVLIKTFDKHWNHCLNTNLFHYTLSIAPFSFPIPMLVALSFLFFFAISPHKTTINHFDQVLCYIIQPIHI